MEMLPQAGTDFSRGPVIPRAGAGPATGEPEAVCTPLSLRSAVRLLAEARRALWSDQDEAHQYIAKAVALLKSESEIGMIDTSTAPAVEGSRLAPWQVKRVLSFIDDNLAEKIGVENFAAVARLSKSHFARAFRATVGEAPHAYLIRRRVESAQEMILFTQKPLARIAVDCGLGDQAHMTRLFRRVVGVSPGAWRRHSASARELTASLPREPLSTDRAAAAEPRRIASTGRRLDWPRSDGARDREPMRRAA